MNLARAFAAVSLVAATCCSTLLAADADAVPKDPPARQWKGNLHTHSLWSDGDDFPEMIAEWYRTHDYNFLTLSDHNVLSEGIRWMKVSDIVKRGGKDALAKYQARFGGGWVETRGKDADSLAVRLKPLNEFRSLVETRGEFIMMQGEEVSDRAEGKPVHMNASNIGEAIQPLGGETVREAMANNLRSVDEQAKRLGREIMMHLNHPNFGWAVTAEDLAAVTAERFFEVYNGHPGVNHLGDTKRPGVERIWDLANTLRISGGTAPLLGIATDDSHDYHDQGKSRLGRGWVMVTSKYLTPEHLIRAMRAGNFYASSGVTLDKVEYDTTARTLSVEIAASNDATFTTEFIGSRDSEDQSGVGIVLATKTGRSVSYQIDARDLYVRAVITSSEAAVDPSFDKQKQQAWTQPVGWESSIKP